MIPKKIVSSTTLQIENKKSEKGFKFQLTE